MKHFLANEWEHAHAFAPFGLRILLVHQDVRSACKILGFFLLEGVKASSRWRTQNNKNPDASLVCCPW